MSTSISCDTSGKSSLSSSLQIEGKLPYRADVASENPVDGRRPEDHSRREKNPPPAALVAIGKSAPVAVHTFSSQFASAVATAVFYPLDLLRTRYMSQDGSIWRQHNGTTYNSIYRSLRTIIREEGVRTLFKGCPVAVCGAVTAWGLYMFFYRQLCNETQLSSLWGRSGLSMAASLSSTIIASPIFLIKSRMQLEEANTVVHYRTFRGSVMYVLKTDGVRALWRGVSLQLLLVFPNALGIPVYDYLKATLLRYRWHNHAEMMKVRLQDQRARIGDVQYSSASQTFVTILKSKGIAGMYRGFTTALAHSLPRALLHYVVYEKTLNFLCEKQK